MQWRQLIQPLKGGDGWVIEHDGGGEPVTAMNDTMPHSVKRME
jgi:hypothetical protein